MFIQFLKSLSHIGLLIGLVFFCASLTPSLLPRAPIVQGALSGIVFAVGYSIGSWVNAAWSFLELRELKGIIISRLTAGIGSLLLILAAITLGRMNVWQNSIRDLMEMPPVETFYPIRVAVIALILALLLILITRGVGRLCLISVKQTNRWLPRRIALATGSIAAIMLIVFAVNGLILKTSLELMDNIFSVADQNFKLQDDSTMPTDQLASLIRWKDIGRNGEKFLTEGPNKEEISQWLGRSAKEPIRVYAGYNTGDTLQHRAELALKELIRNGGFDRKVLIVAVPTGTGWLDPAAIQPVAFLHEGDLSIISMQYSYLPSWLTIIIDPDRSRRAAKALFNTVYNHWIKLPAETRPKLYLFGLSLGALGSEASADLITLLADPIQGALWSGPPFASKIWPSVTQGRNVDSPEWRPEFRDGSAIRFMTKDGFSATQFAPWGPLRVVYLQHASDPMSFFSPSLAFQRPDWLGENRGPDVSSYFDWYPIVTFLQVTFDIPMATSVPAGFGHTFTPASYIDGWIAVTEPKGWTSSDIERLKDHFANFDASPI